MLRIYIKNDLFWGDLSSSQVLREKNKTSRFCNICRHECCLTCCFALKFNYLSIYLLFSGWAAQKDTSCRANSTRAVLLDGSINLHRITPHWHIVSQGNTNMSTEEAVSKPWCEDLHVPALHWSTLLTGGRMKRDGWKSMRGNGGEGGGGGCRGEILHLQW